MITIDFHVHGKLKSSMPFCVPEFLQKIKEAKLAGLNSFVLNEHSHSVNFEECYEYLSANFTRIDDCFEKDGFKVFTGVEITTDEGLDVIVITCPELVLEYSKKCPKGILFKNLVDCLTKDESTLVVFAHPFRSRIDFAGIDKDLLKVFDAVELNAADLATLGEDQNTVDVKALAKTLGVNVIGGSDSHFSIQCGSIKTIFEKDFTRICEMKNQIHAGTFSVEVDDALSIRVKSAALIKDLMVNNATKA
ncbi:MAG: PHP domain-containing protein [Firmicutes bacterium]|nr:PHP domain-containing protein [Bacillota bacterium]